MLSCRRLHPELQLVSAMWLSDDIITLTSRWTGVPNKVANVYCHCVCLSAQWMEHYCLISTSCIPSVCPLILIPYFCWDIDLNEGLRAGLWIRDSYGTRMSDTCSLLLNLHPEFLFKSLLGNKSHVFMPRCLCPAGLLDLFITALHSFLFFKCSSISFSFPTYRLSFFPIDFCTISKILQWLKACFKYLIDHLDHKFY